LRALADWQARDKSLDVAINFVWRGKYYFGDEGKKERQRTFGMFGKGFTVTYQVPDVAKIER
jgi:hypothetical protein